MNTILLNNQIINNFSSGQLNNPITNLIDHVLTRKNLTRFIKSVQNPETLNKTYVPRFNNEEKNINANKRTLRHKYVVEHPQDNVNNEIDNKYIPRQTDSLFWCFYILKYGYFNYEVECINKYFTIEKEQKYKFIEILRKSKDILKLHKIKPFTQIEEDLANSSNISIKSFFALCAINSINVMLISGKKVYKIILDETKPINIIHRNNTNLEHYIEIISDTNLDKMIDNYKINYYQVDGFESTLKSIKSYKLDELQELCYKFDIKLDGKKTKTNMYSNLIQYF